MAEPLKNHFGPEIPHQIARMISAVFPGFQQGAFIRDALDGYDALNLLPRGWKIARTLRQYLPEDYAEAAEILIASLGPKLHTTEELGMAPFLYLPHVLFVAEYGLDHFKLSMRAQYELTQRFSAEFSIRRYLEKYPEETLARLKIWATDSNAHVRRLVSEGTRPRLPWVPRLRAFQADPRPALALLELLKDDAEPGALDILGFSHPARASVRRAIIAPKRVLIGDSVSITFEIANTDSERQRVLVDLRVHFMKANGKTRPKIFKLKAIDLAPQEVVQMRKTISLAEMTTRKHYPGTHQVDLVLNGRADPLGAFELLDLVPPPWP